MNELCAHLFADPDSIRIKLLTKMFYSNKATK